MNGQLEVNLSSQRGGSIKDVWPEVPERLVVSTSGAGGVWAAERPASGRINKGRWDGDPHAGTRVMRLSRPHRSTLLYAVPRVISPLSYVSNVASTQLVSHPGLSHQDAVLM